MTKTKWIIVVVAIALAFSACAKKQTTPIEQPVEQPPVAAPPVEQPKPVEQPPVVQEKPVALEDVFFDFDRYSLTDEAKAVLTRNAEALMANASKRVLVQGHCDERGTNEYNMALGEKRAKAVVDFYTSYGIPADRVTWISYGEEKPFDLGHDEAAWAKNRRAHMVIQ